jgi:hypothetical protein
MSAVYGDRVRRRRAQVRQRPGHLVDGTGVFDVDVPCTAPVVGEE